MKGKVLFTASIAKHILRFHLPYLKWFQDNGYITHVACNGVEQIPYVNEQFQICFSRNPYSIINFKAYKSLKELFNKNEYILIHCHTPVASVLTRFAAKDTRARGSKVIYTSHGFHFFKGGPIFNWISYYPVELILRKYTDAIITINSEDFDLMNENKLPTLQVYKIPGVGVNSRKFSPVDNTIKEKIRFKHGYSSSQFILIYAAELITRKNHDFLINATYKLKDKIPDLKIIFAGRGRLEKIIKEKIIKLGLEEYIDVLGFRDDINDLFCLSDICVSASKQEGLGLNLVEAMFCGLPVVASDDRGHKEVVLHGQNGYLFPQKDLNCFMSYIEKLYNNFQLRNLMSASSLFTSKKFELLNSMKEMEHIYDEMLIKK